MTQLVLQTSPTLPSSPTGVVMESGFLGLSVGHTDQDQLSPWGMVTFKTQTVCPSSILPSLLDWGHISTVPQPSLLDWGHFSTVPQCDSTKDTNLLQWCNTQAPDIQDCLNTDRSVFKLTDLHILSDPVTNFWKCPKKGLKNYFLNIFYQSRESNQIQYTI